MEKMSSGRKTGKIFLKTAAWAAGIWAALLVVIQIVLSPAFLTKALAAMTRDHIDGELKFGKVSASVFRHFPNISMTLDDVSLTYPSERFAAYDSTGPGNRFLKAGNGEVSDTLASFGSFSASINLASLLVGEINLPYIHIGNPRIFAKSYNDSTANWNIFKSSQSEEKNDASILPDFVVGRLHLDDRPLITYCSKADSVFVAIRFDKMAIRRHGKHYDLAIHAKTGISTAATGRMRLPLDIHAAFELPKDTIPSLSVKKLDAKIAGIPLNADADVKYLKDSIYVRCSASIGECKTEDVMQYLGKNIWEGTEDLHTDAVITMRMNADGWYHFDGSMIPEFDFSLSVPDSHISHTGLRLNSDISTDITAGGGNGEPVNIIVNHLNFNGNVIKLRFKGSAGDLLGEDPEFSIDGSLSVPLDSLGKFFGDEKGFSASGTLSAEAKGRIKLSQINMYRFVEADLRGFIKSGRIDFSSVMDTVGIHADSLDIVLATTGNTRDKSVEQGKRMLAVVANVDSTAINYKNLFTLRGKDISLKAQNDAAVLNPGDSSSYYPFGGRLDIGMLTLMDRDSCRITVGKSGNVFKISPSSENKKNPVLTLRSSSNYIRAVLDMNRIAIRGLDINATATKSADRRKRMAKRFVDSVAREYPDVPRDSLFSHLRKIRGRKILPDWLTEKDFQKKDFDFRLDESLAKYYREWDFDGSMGIRRAFIMTPLFPLRTSMENFEGNISNNEISLKNFSIKSGTSQISATGRLRGLRNALLRNGPVNLDLDIKSERLNVNELLGAYSIGSKHDRPGHFSGQGDMSDEEYQQMIAIDTLENAVPEPSLIVVPANLNADVSFEATNVSYAKLDMSWAAADITMKERCILLSNTVASTNIGDMYFEGFYSSRTKQDIKTGFNLDLTDVTAEKVIGMFPAVDTLMPMLKSFKGLLDCEIAATSQIDTSMSIILPSLSGVIRIGGKDLALEGTDGLYDMMKLLKFKDIHRLNIDEMSVEGIISDNTLEIFPFVLSVDRYSLAMSGLQNMDQTFKYHISVLKSPLLVRFGVNLWGDFDKFKFKIGKAKYKNKKVPVFSAVVDETRLNLSNAIRNVFTKGVDAAVKENERQSAINEHKKAIKYENAAESSIVELSEDEKIQLEEEVEAPEEDADTTGLAPLQPAADDTTKKQENSNEQSGIH